MASPLVFGSVQFTLSWLEVPTADATDVVGAAGAAGTPAGLSSAE